MVDKLNSKIKDLNLQKDDIDIAHRVGKKEKRQEMTDNRKI